MIAKRIMRGKAGDFGRLGEYIVNGDTKGNSNQGALTLGGKAAEEAAIWQRTADYIVDALAGGQRACIVRITNCRADNLEDAIAEITATQTINRRAKGDRTYHLVVSFPPGETPTPEQLRDIEDELCRAIGLGKHQRISAVHADTKHLHMHIAINQVHPETRACIEPWQDRPKLMRACERLEIKHGLTRTNHSRVRVESQAGLAPKTTAASTIDKTPVGAKAMERHGGLESLLSWVRREVASSLLAVVATGAGWQDLHRILAEHGLEIRRRGAGLIIASGKTAIKASDVHRLLSMKSLQDKWGAFERAEPHAEVQVKKTYRRGPMHREVDELFEDWQRSGDDFRADMDKLNEKIRKRLEITKEHAINQHKIIEDYSPRNAKGRRVDHERLHYKIQRVFDEDMEWAKAQRAELRKKHSVLSWPEYLRQAASNGNIAALRALRRNASRYQQALNAVTQPDQRTSDIVIRELKPETRADGTVIYTLRDGGKVADDGRQVRIERDSDNARSLTLTIMAARSRMNEVALKGDDAQAFIEAAARNKLTLNFRNSVHDQERKRLVAVYEREDAVLAASGFVARRNAARGAEASILPHRLWQGSDTGSAHYEGTVDLGEGIHAILVRKEGEIVVLPRTASEAAPMPTPGTVIAVSEQGQVAVPRGQGR